MITPTTETQQDPSAIAVSFRERLITLRSRMTRDFLEMGALLSAIDEHSLWAGYAESFRDYCDDPEIGISYRTARKLVRVYREAERLGLVNSQALLRAGVERAAAVLPAAADGEDAVVRLQEASCLPVREVQLMYRGQDPQVRAMESILGRFEQLNSATRVLLMICQYWRLTYHERLELWMRIKGRSDQAQDQPVPAGDLNGEAHRQAQRPA